MRKNLSFPVLKSISCSAVFAILLAIVMICGGLSSAEAATGTLTTNHWKKGSTEGYSIKARVQDTTGMASSVTLDGPGAISVPLVPESDGSVYYVAEVAVSRPSQGASYTVSLTYSDGTPTESLPLTVSGVVDSFAAAVAPVGAVADAVTPLFKWSLPSQLPTAYAIGVTDLNGYPYWRSVTPIGSTATSKGYNFDGATDSVLSAGVWYTWSLFWVDAIGNTAETRSDFLYGANFGGKVTDVNGAPVSGATVSVFDSNNAPAFSTETAADGSYVCGGLITGNYRVRFTSAGNFPVWYNNKIATSDADVLSVTAGVTNFPTNINATVGAWGAITGKVLNESLAAVSGATVTLYDGAGNVVSAVAPATTKSDGTYALNLVPVGLYQVKYSKTGYLTAWNPGVDVTSGQTTEFTDAVLSKVQITGSVTDGNGNPLPNIWIWLYDSTGNFAAGYTGVATASDGSYAIGGIAPGTYRVQFDSVRAYAMQYYNRKGTLSQADGITVTSTGTVSNVNGVLSSGKPTITLTAPAASKSRTVAVTFSATETNGVTGYMLTETSSAPTATAAGWLSSAPSSYTFGSEGNKTLYAWAKGYTGLVSGLSKAIVVDTTPPAITVSTLSDLAVTSNATLNLTGKATVSNSTLASLKIQGTAVNVASDGSFNYAVHLATGANAIALVATDAGGLQTTVTRTITLNAAAPALAVTAPADGSATGATVLTVAGTVASGSTVQVFVNGTPQTATVNGTAFTTDVDLASGANTLEIVATDASNNTNRAKRTVTLLSSGPDLQIGTPVEDITTNLTVVTVSGTTTGTSVSITAGLNTYTPTVSGGSFSQAVTLGNQGVNQVVVSAADNSGIQTTVQRNIIVSGKAGDCNLDGKVSLSEVQSAIMMFLGNKAVTACVDASGDGKVLLSEVQKIIKAFLGP